MFVLGTAGHVDHGKSSLIQALTGIHPDRLREEQERGMTIALGFAWMTLPSGREVSIVDVPGHVRFVRHMLAGIGAVDLALLVVAADEGVMPQTREHLAILDLLEVRHAVVALTKADLVDTDWTDLVAEEVREALAGTSLAGAPVVAVSSATGAGLDELRATIDAALDTVPEPHDIGRPRLGIDRAFTMSGFGTVVTGTLLDGRLAVGDTVEVAPGRRSARIRGLQTHRHDVPEAQPGTRVAVNLAGLDTDEVSRGQVLARPGRMTEVRAFDARVRVLDGQALRHNLRVAVHAGSAEAHARARVLGGGVLGGDTIDGPGEGWVQFILAEPIAVTAGDLFVVRVSDETVGGGRIVDLNPPRHRRTSPAVIERLATLAAGTPESRLLAALERLEPATAAAVAGAVELDRAEAAQTIEALIAEGIVRSFGGAGMDALLMTSARLDALRADATRRLHAYHAAHPLRVTMPREELRSGLALPARGWTAILDGLAPDVQAHGDGVAAAGWTPSPSAAQQSAIDAAVAALEAGGLQPPRLTLDAEIEGYLEATGTILDCGDGVLLHAPAFERARAALTAAMRERGSLTLAEARDLLDTNRRNTQAILETLDRLGVTRRQGEARVLRGDAGA